MIGPRNAVVERDDLAGVDHERVVAVIVVVGRDDQHIAVFHRLNGDVPGIGSECHLAPVLEGEHGGLLVEGDAAQAASDLLGGR